MTDRPTIVVEVRGPSRSGVTTLTRLLTQLLRHHLVRERVVGPLLVARSANDCIETLFNLGSTVEVREAEPDDRDRELAGLRMERDRLKQDVGRLSREDWRPFSTVPQYEYVELFLEEGERGTPSSVLARCFLSSGEHPTHYHSWSFWTEGGPNSGSDFELPDQKLPTHWRPVRPGPDQEDLT